ncbi:MAG: hypothetical protein WC682_05200 [Parcubacteria group bacterium]|jgi:hypothetical protein
MEIKIFSKKNISSRAYYIFKELGKMRLSENDSILFLEFYFTNQKLSHKRILSILINVVDSFSDKKKAPLLALLYQIKNNIELEVFIFALKLIQIKPLLLAEAKLTEISNLSKLKNINQLSIEYDTISKSRPYYTRVNGALLSLLFFSKLEERDSSFISESTEQYINTLFKQYSYLRENGLEPNQMFMLMFSESINQSIISDAGSSYEDRIFNILIGLGIRAESIRKMHDKNDSSTEFDFFFKLSGKSYGIGAKRTLRERYKQFIKTAQMSKLDVMIEITLGLDLSEEKARAIRDHQVHLFVADEIYYSKEYLQRIDGIYPAGDLTIGLLKKLSKLR